MRLLDALNLATDAYSIVLIHLRCASYIATIHTIPDGSNYSTKGWTFSGFITGRQWEATEEEH